MTEMERGKERLIDEEWIRIAEERLAHYRPEDAIPAEDVYRECGITDADLEGREDVKIE